MIKIEKNIPIPDKLAYPFDALEIGDSFEVQGKTTKQFAGKVYISGKKLGKKFTMRATTAGVRVWRIM
jgi:hypothetical protein